MKLISRIKRIFNRGKKTSPQYLCDLIESIVSSVIKIEIDEIRGKGKGERRARSRVLIAHFLGQYGYSPYDISRMMKRHRSTIYYYIKRYNELILCQSFQKKEEEVRRILKSKKINK